MHEPSYIRTYREGRLQEKILQALNHLQRCDLCPRECHVNRYTDERGICRTGRYAIVASIHAHYGEEAPLVGSGGSGTIFFSSCNLLCSFCQNYEISHLMEGRETGPGDLAAMMMSLQSRGCHNINFVTPTHVTAQILESLPIAIEAGLNIPLVYNCGGYEKRETIKLLEGVVDIYMPDFKFWYPESGEAFCRAPDYRLQAAAAIREMHHQVGDLKINEEGVAERGLLVRHLVMPGRVNESEEIMKFLAALSTDTYVNIMDQYRPCGMAMEDPNIGRRTNRSEWTTVCRQALDAGLHRLDKE
jgi:putative pyruvate formate lyase activating enzyme